MTTREGEWPSFGQLLRRLRDQRSWTQRQLADHEDVRVGQSYLAKVERDERRPSLELAQRLDAAFGTTPQLTRLALTSASRRPGGIRLERPAQLPAATKVFVGREQELSLLDALLDRTLGGMPLAVVEGGAGVGKTDLVLRWANGVKDQFPDGQLFCDLRGFDRLPPADPDEALGGCLRAVGFFTVLDDLGQTFRTLLSTKKVLIVLDNAASSQQVLPLLPAASDSMVVITSRVRLLGLQRQAGGERITLGGLHPDESRALLQRILGEERVRTEPQAVEALATACGQLPQALRAVAAHAAAHPHQTLSQLVDIVCTDTRAWTVLSPPGDPKPLRESIAWSHDACTPPAADMLRTVSVLPSREFSTPAAAAGAGCTVAIAHDRLTELANLHLVDEIAENRWHLPKLIARYTWQQTSTDETQQRLAVAREQGLQWYLHAMAEVSHELMPHHPRPSLDASLPLPLLLLLPTGLDHGRALAWAEAEAPAVVDGIDVAYQHGLLALAWRLAATTAGYLRLRTRWPLAVTAITRGLHAAREAGDPEGQAWCHHELGVLLGQLCRLPEALEHLDEALRLRAHDEHEKGSCHYAWSLHARADVYLRLGRWQDAHDSYHQALKGFLTCGEEYGHALALIGVGSAQRRLGRTEDTHKLLSEALNITTVLDSAAGQSHAHLALAEFHQADGHTRQGLWHIETALSLRRTIGDLGGEVEALLRYGDMLHDNEHFERAEQCWQHALTLLTPRDPRTVAVYSRLATVDTSDGNNWYSIS